MSTSGENCRRVTPLGEILKMEIAANGPISVDTYMRHCLSDPQHGYYTTQSGIGRDGDFTTAPEISQVYGELLGLWAAVAWQQMGAPGRVNLIELGPGRGTLMSDALRAARLLPGFVNAIDVHLCEINPYFRERQAEQLEPHQISITWHETWPELGPSPSIVIANEFLDTIPGSQWTRDAKGAWHEIQVGLDKKGQLSFVRTPRHPLFDEADLPPALTTDPIYTEADFSGLIADLAQQAETGNLAALFIDYGHTSSAWGDTLQAVRNHRAEHPLKSPGQADLSLAVDFGTFQRAAESSNLICDGPVTQAEFLGQLGIAERASKLMTNNPDRANEIESAIFRLMSATGMGTLFHAIGVRSFGTEPLPGFAMAAP